jgi:hypothetical protein
MTLLAPLRLRVFAFHSGQIIQRQDAMAQGRKGEKS